MRELFRGPKSFKNRYQLFPRNLSVPGREFMEPLFLAEHRLFPQATQPTVDTHAPQHTVAAQNQAFFARTVADLDVRVIQKCRIQHIFDVE